MWSGLKESQRYDPGSLMPSNLGSQFSHLQVGLIASARLASKHSCEAPQEMKAWKQDQLHNLHDLVQNENI